MINIGDKVKHHVGRGSMFAYTDGKGYLVGKVKAVYASDSYVLQTRGSEILLSGVKNAIPLSDEEFDQTFHPAASTPRPSVPKPQSTGEQKEVKATSHKRPPTHVAEGEVSKADRAVLIYERMMKENNGQHPSRAAVIQTFVAELGMTEAGASTYQCNTKKKFK